MQSRSPAVFIVGGFALLALWLPPLSLTWGASGISQSVLDFLRLNPSDQLRWDYFIIPFLFVYALVVTIKSRPTISECGFDFKHFNSACRWLLLPTIAGLIILFGIGYFSHSIDINPRFWKRAILNSAIFQQICIQLFFHRQWMSWFGKGQKTAWIITIFFVLLHAPNPGLMLGTLVGMYFWARCYQLHPNIYALSISQAFLAATLMHTMPKWMLPSVSVGYRFVEKAMANNWWR